MSGVGERRGRKVRVRKEEKERGKGGSVRKPR